MWGKFPKGGEGSDPNPIHIFLCFFQFRSLLNGKKTVKKCEHSQTGGRGEGSATWEFFPHNPVFFLTTFLRDVVTYGVGSHNICVVGRSKLFVQQSYTTGARKFFHQKKHKNKNKLRKVFNEEQGDKTSCDATMKLLDCS